MPEQKDIFDIHCSHCEDMIISGVHKGNVLAYEKIELKCSKCGFNGVGIHSGLVNLLNTLRREDGLTSALPNTDKVKSKIGC